MKTNRQDSFSTVPSHLHKYHPFLLFLSHFPNAPPLSPSFSLSLSLSISLSLCDVIIGGVGDGEKMQTTNN